MISWRAGSFASLSETVRVKSIRGADEADVQYIDIGYVYWYIYEKGNLEKVIYFFFDLPVYVFQGYDHEVW